MKTVLLLLFWHVFLLTSQKTATREKTRFESANMES
jgi:hypothetical protein